ncbi:hypothetical protein P3342_004737 [Pyrenophora teres f. teres]|nr:hypothetical protein P3342_004737 [Pyrenophora teres f. teres]
MPHIAQFSTSYGHLSGPLHLKRMSHFIQMLRLIRQGAVLGMEFNLNEKQELRDGKETHYWSATEVLELQVGFMHFWPNRSCGGGGNPYERPPPDGLYLMSMEFMQISSRLRA